MSEQQGRAHEVISTGIDALAEQRPYPGEGVAAHRTYDGDGVRLRQVAFEPGAVLAEHIAPVPIIVQVVEGAVAFRVEGVEHELARGGFIQVDARVPHEVEARGASRIVITLIG